VDQFVCEVCDFPVFVNKWQKTRTFFSIFQKGNYILYEWASQIASNKLLHEKSFQPTLPFLDWFMVMQSSVAQELFGSPSAQLAYPGYRFDPVVSQTHLPSISSSEPEVQNASLK
jgi:hypothetical protein